MIRIETRLERQWNEDMPDTAFRTNMLLLVLLSTLWGASYTFIKVGVETIPPITFIAARTIIGGAVLLLVLRLRGLTLPRDRRLWGMFLVQACFNSVIPFTLIAWAETRIDAGLAIILNSLSPVMTFLLTALVTRHEAVPGRKLFGVLAGLAGATLIVGMDALNGVGMQVWAQLAVVLATLSYGCAAIFGKRFTGVDPIIPAAGSMICGAAILIPLSLIFDQPWTLSPSGASIAALLGLSIFSTALAFVIFFHLLQALGSVGAQAQAYIRVPIGVGIGMYFLGEQPTQTAVIGLVLILAGVVAMTWPPRSRTQAA